MNAILELLVVIANALVPNYIILILGYLACRIRLLTSPRIQQRGFNRYVYFVTLPFFLFGILSTLEVDSVLEKWAFFLTFVVWKLVCLVIALVLAGCYGALELCHVLPPPNKKQTFSAKVIVTWFSLSYPNGLSLGYPIVVLLYGAPLGVYAVMAFIADLLMTIPIAEIFLLAYKKIASLIANAKGSKNTVASLEVDPKPVDPLALEPEGITSLDETERERSDSTANNENDSNPPGDSISGVTTDGDGAEGMEPVAATDEAAVVRDNANEEESGTGECELQREENQEEEQEQEEEQNTPPLAVGPRVWRECKFWLWTVLQLFGRPVIFGIVLGLLVAVLEIPVPEMVRATVVLLGGATVPTMLFGIGMFFYGRSLTQDCPLYITLFLTVLRVIVAPSIMGVIAVTFGLRGVELEIALLLAVLPLAVTGFTICNEHGCYPEAVISTIIVTTCLSPLTIFGVLFVFRAPLLSLGSILLP
jgi:predicted permease